MHLLFITREAHPCHRSDVAVLFGKYLPRHGITSDLVAISTNDKVAPWGGGVTLVKKATKFKHLNVLLEFVNSVIALVTAKGPYCAIQVRDNPLVSLFAIGIARYRNIPFFYWMSFPIVDGYFHLAKQGPRQIGWMRYLFALAKGHVGRFILNNIVFSFANHVFVQSDQMKRDLVQLGIVVERCTAVPMGVDTEAANLSLIRPSNDPRLRKRRVVVYLGSLDRTRRIDLIIEALSIAVREQPNLLLILAGSAPEKSEEDYLKSLATERELDNYLLWTGWLPMHEAWRYVAAAEIGLSLIPRGTLYDCSSPTKAAEYLALGVPVLANDLPDQVWMIQQSGGGVCVPFDPITVGSALVSMLRNGDQLRQMGNRGCIWVQDKRSYKALSNDLAKQYRQLVGSVPSKA